MVNLENGLVSNGPWDLCEASYSADRAVTAGSNFMVGNGYFGYRGTFPDEGADEYVAMVLTDTYDTADGVWRELASLPNPLKVTVTCGGTTLCWREAATLCRGIDLSAGEWYARAEFPEENVVLVARRFASYADLHALCQRITIGPLDPGRRVAPIEVSPAIDTNTWSLNGEHLAETELVADESGATVSTKTQEMGTEIAMNVVYATDAGNAAINGRERTYHFDVNGGPVALDTLVGIYGANDLVHERDRREPYRVAAAGELARRVVPDLVVAGARETAEALAGTGFDAARQSNRRAWSNLWRRFDVTVTGDAVAQVVARFNTYHAVIAAPLHTDHLPIGARGLSCQAYQGAAFWDQEIFNLPMFLHTLPRAARSILVYRHRTIGGARKKAADLGYRGAFYAWVSGETGEEICPSYFFRDVISGRRIRNHFNDWQIHISPDIVYTISRYVSATGDRDFLVERGAEIVFEVARFLVSRSHLRVDKNTFEIIRVLGPDEYHENVDNNAFTNYQARFAVAYGIHVLEAMRSEVPADLDRLMADLGLTETETEQWARYVDRIFVPEPDAETRLIEQFTGFFDHEDITPDRLRERLLDPGEYWGWPNGIAVETQVAKQADVLQLMALHPDAYDYETVRANWRYYEPRAQHGSSLSPAVHAVTAARVGLVDDALRYFWKAATVDLYNTNRAVSGGTFIGGIHTAACGALWDVVVSGFAGMRTTPDGYRFAPNLPASWERVSFFLEHRGAAVDVTVSGREVSVSADAGNERAVVIDVEGQSEPVEPGATRSLSLER